MTEKECSRGVGLRSKDGKIPSHSFPFSEKGKTGKKSGKRAKRSKEACTQNLAHWAWLSFPPYYYSFWRICEKEKEKGKKKEKKEGEGNTRES